MSVNDRGAGTVLAAGLALSMLVLMMLVVGLATAAVAAGKAATAADLAALAAADAFRGLREGSPCHIAAEVAAANSATLVACTELAGSKSVQLKVAVRTTLPWPAYGQARAGPPADSVPPGSNQPGP
ncbi:Rv3654c family TadE-like protein [Arthrobacter sp. Sr24]